MAHRIQTLGAPCLRQIASPVPSSMFGTPRLYGLVKDMIETMTEMNGAGIAAPQIGEPWRVFVVHGTGNNPRYPYKPAVPLTVFINPVIEVLQDDPMHMIEGCLSVPGMRGSVIRHCKVRCSAQTVDGTPFVLRAEGHVAGTLQHEQDHLDGQLFTDITKNGLMTGDAFEKYYKKDFFKYAADINVKYPTPIVWESNGPDNVDHNINMFTSHDSKFDQTTSTTSSTSPHAVITSTSNAASTTTIYEPTLCWTGSSFERDMLISVDESTGKITSVEKKNNIENGKNNIIKLDDFALTPGFVNAHSHAFQRGLRGRGETYPPSIDGGEKIPSFWTWRDAMYGLVNELDSKEKFKEQTYQCFHEMANAGITTVGEFHYFRHNDIENEDYDLDQIVIEAAREANVRLILLNACYERGGFDNSSLGIGQNRFRSTDINKYWEQMDYVETLLDTTRGNGLGAVIHSLRAVGLDSTKQISNEANIRNMKVHVHLEEQQKEIDDCLSAHGMRPLDLLMQTVPREELANFVAVHCTHSEPKQLQEYFHAGGGICVCPLTEASLGDGVFLSPEACNGIVSLGTDCNARIDMFEEMRWLEYSQRLARHRRGVYTSIDSNNVYQGDIASLLMDNATVYGASHLGVETGKIEPGKWADFAKINLNATALKNIKDEHMMGAMILGGSGEGLVVDTCMAGKWTQRV
jgi:formimidoylglutamate deiminase